MQTLWIDQICFEYGAHQVLKDISFSANKGEYVYILGPNGVGKSTLFRVIMGHLKASVGSVWIEEKKISDYKVSELAKKVAYIPQRCHAAFDYSVMQLALMGRSAYLSPFSAPSEKDYIMAYETLEKLGIRDKADCKIRKISGGERQLAMIARALMQQASILIMDEPTASLDYGNQIRIQMQMKQLTKEGYLVLQSCHNPEHTMLFADKVIALYDGKVVAAGTVEETMSEKLLWRLYGLSVVLDHKMCRIKLDKKL